MPCNRSGATATIAGCIPTNISKRSPTARRERRVDRVAPCPEPPTGIGASTAGEKREQAPPQSIRGATTKAALRRGSVRKAGIYSGGCSGLAAETDVIVEVEQVEPGGDVLPVLGDLRVEFVKEGAGFGVCGHAAFLVGGPGGDVAGAGFGCRRLLDPLENFAVAFAGGELLFEGLGVDTGEFEEALVQGAIEFEIG